MTNRVLLELDLDTIPRARFAQGPLAQLVLDAATGKPWASGEVLERNGIRVVGRPDQSDAIDILLNGAFVLPSKLDKAQRTDIEAHIRGTSDGGPETYPQPEHGWTCFHCGENFKTPRGARLHFGEEPTSEPLCFGAAEMVFQTIEKAYGLLWHEQGSPQSRAARKLLLSMIDKEGQKRGIEHANRLFGENDIARELDALSASIAGEDADV